MDISNITQLPIEIINNIYYFIPLSIKAYLRLDLFKKYYNAKLNTMHFSEYSKYDAYIRDIIRNNRVLPFKMMINKAFHIWDRSKIWKWKNLKFPDYISYINYLSLRYEKHEIKNIIKLNKKYLSRKKPKRISSKNILWNN